MQVPPFHQDQEREAYKELLPSGHIVDYGGYG